MEIKEVSFGLTLTQTLPGHNNVKPFMSLTATVEEGEDWQDAHAELVQIVENYVQEYVNQSLEAEGKAAKYHNGPTFQIMHNKTAKSIIILPNESEWPEGYTHWYVGDSRKLRFSNAVDVAKRKADELGWQWIDISDGDLSKVPPIPEPEPRDYDDGIPF